MEIKEKKKWSKPSFNLMDTSFTLSNPAGTKTDGQVTSTSSVPLSYTDFSI